MKKYHLYLNAEERRVILNSLIEKKIDLSRTGHYTDAIDEIIIKLTKARIKRVRIKEV